jgi:hypothetical protein
MQWAKMLGRVFSVDLERCPACGGEFKLVAAIIDGADIVKSLTHLELPARAPPRGIAQGEARLECA